MVTVMGMAMKQLDAFNQQNVNQIQKTLIEPLIKFGSVFPSLIIGNETAGACLTGLAD